MKKSFYLILTIILITSCKEDKRIVERIDFKTEYKFSSEVENKIAIDTVPWKYQISASEYAKKGDYKNALAHWDKAMSGRELNYSKEEIDSINLKYSKVNASDYIIEKAEENQVIIINEAHHNSYHRVFTKSLLKRLYDKGYKNLGLEALANNEIMISDLNKRKYPTQNSGHYISDPQFGDLVREALEIGFKVFAYEATTRGADGVQREIEQAENIKKQIDLRPNEKFLIHCGFDHALEGIHSYWEKAMAERLVELTGINPLTINQTEYSEKSKPELDHPLLKALNINNSSILLDKENKPMKYKRGESYTDIAVLHPNTEYIDNRPHWIFEFGNKKVLIDLSDVDIEFPILVMAFKKGEDIDSAVPIDILEMGSKKESCNLGLKKGDYQVVLTNGKESLRFEKKVK